MNMMKKFNLIALPLLLVIFLSACGHIREPEFKGIKNVSTDHFSFRDPLLRLELSYFNPNRSGLKIKYAEGDAWADGEFIGHFTMDTLVRISGESDFILPVQFKPDLKPLLKNSLQTLLGQAAQLKIEGKARVGKGMIYVNYPIRYEGKHSLSELLGHR
ncbi:MAG: LEA type 2 family protein [Bacteroidetes bacterium]|nr:LEA type 2 family protein [Bacteroidota bacterium]